MPSDIRTAAVRVTIPALVTGLRNLTGAFAWTPKAALCVMTRAQSTGVHVNSAVIGIGATDGVNRWALTQKSEDGVGRSDDDGRAMADECLALNDLSAGISGEFDLDAFVPGGMRVNIGNGFSLSHVVDIIFFGGADLEAHAGSKDVNAGATVDVTDPGFQPDLVISAGAHILLLDDSNVGQFMLALAASSRAANPPPQGSISTYEANNKSVGNCNQYVSSTEVLRQTINGSSPQGVLIQDYDASGFSFVSSGGLPVSVGYLALKVGDRQVWANNFSTPAATGSFDHTDPGFKPQLVVNFMSMMSAIDTHVGTEAGDEGPAVGSLGIAAIATDPMLVDLSQTISIEDASATTDTQSLATEDISLPQDDGTPGIVGSITSFISTGWRVNYTAILGATARRWLGFAIEETGAAGPSQSVAGAQPSGSGVLSTAVTFKEAMAGTQPSGSGAFTTKLTAFVAPAGVQPSGTGALTLALSLSQSIVGAQPSASGALSTKPSLNQLGAQPAGSGVLSPTSTFKLTLTGTQPSGAAALTAIPTISFFQSVSGVQGDPAAILTIDARTQSETGLQPSGNGVLSAKVTYKVALGGTQPAGLDTGPPGQQFGRLATVFTGATVQSVDGVEGVPSGILTIDARTAAFAGTQPTATGAPTLRLAPKKLSLAGTQPSGAAVLDSRKSAQFFRDVSGIQGDPAAILTIDALTQSAAGVQPSGSGAVTPKVTYKTALLGSQPSGVAVVVGDVVGTSRAVSGVQGDPSGTLTIDARTQSVAGTQPSGTGTVTAQLTLKISVDGIQPAGLDRGNPALRFGRLDTLFIGAARVTIAGQQGEPSSILTIDARTQSVTGAQPSGSSTLAAKVTYKVSLAGAQPSGTATLIALPAVTFVRAVSGSQGDPSGILTIDALTQSTDGAQPSASGATATKVTYKISLSGVQLAGSGLLVTLRVGAILKSVSGSQGDPSGILTIDARTATLLGAQPSGSGIVTTKLTAARSLVGVQFQATGTLVALEKQRSIAGTQPSGSGVLTTILTAKQTLAGAQPSGSGVLTSQVFIGAFVDVNEIIEIIDASKIPAGASVFWEAHMASAGAQTHRCRLFNVTDNVEVIGSVVDTALTTVERLTSGDIAAQFTGIKEYKAQYTPTNGPKPVVAHAVTETA